MLKTKIRHKTQNVNFAVSMYSFGTLLETFAIYLWYRPISLFSADRNLKKKRTYRNLYNRVFWVLNFNYGIQLSIIHVSKYCLMSVTFFTIGCDFTRWGIDGKINRVSPGYASSGDTLFRDTGVNGILMCTGNFTYYNNYSQGFLYKKVSGTVTASNS